MSFPSPADDYREPALNLNDLIVHPAARFFVRMKGLAMEPTLHAGDVMIVDRALVPLDRRAVVVIFQQQFLVRRIEVHDDQVILKADNPAFADIIADPGEVEVWGVVTYAIHKVTVGSLYYPGQNIRQGYSTHFRPLFYSKKRKNTLYLNSKRSTGAFSA